MYKRQILILNQQSEDQILAKEEGANHLIDEDEEEKKDLIKELIIGTIILKRKKTSNLKKSLKIISLSKKKVNFQNEDETLETNFLLPLYGFAHLNDQL